MTKRQTAELAFHKGAPMKIILHSSLHHVRRAGGHNGKPQVI